MADLASRGITVLPIIFNPPEWRSARPEGDDERGVYPPKDYDDLGDFAKILVERYGPGGDFWKEHPEVPETPIRAWQVWNEPNYPYYWLGGIDAAEYTELLRAAYLKIKEADPAAEVVTAGLVQSGSPKSVDLVTFMEGMYAAGAAQWFDTLAMHPYAATPDKSLALLETTRAVMDAHGDAAPIWATELGWASGGPKSSVTYDEAGQAANLTALLRGMLARREELRLRGLVWWNWKDAPPYAGGSDYWGLHCGLLRIDGTPKPARDAFAAIAADATGPDPFGLLGPPAGLRTREERPALQWQPTADGGSGLDSYEVWMDGARLAAGLPPGTGSFTPAATVAEGDHSWRVVAVDELGNRTASEERRFTVDRSAPVVSLRAASGQRLRKAAKRRRLVVYAACSEGCALQLSADVPAADARKMLRIRGRSKTYPLGRARLDAAPQARKKIVLRLSRRTARRLAASRRLRFWVTATVTDSLGNSGAATRRVTLRR